MPEYVHVIDVTKVTVRLNAVSCYLCGVIFGLDSEYEAERHKDHKTWYCPNGHGQMWAEENEVERVKRLLDEERSRLILVRAERDQALCDAMDQAKEMKRLRRRAQAGVCSKCHRTFPNVAHHMESKHPTPAS